MSVIISEKVVKELKRDEKNSNQTLPCTMFFVFFFMVDLFEFKLGSMIYCAKVGLPWPCHILISFNDVYIILDSLEPFRSIDDSNRVENGLSSIP